MNSCAGKTDIKGVLDALRFILMVQEWMIFNCKYERVGSSHPHKYPLFTQQSLQGNTVLSLFILFFVFYDSNNQRGEVNGTHRNNDSEYNIINDSTHQSPTSETQLTTKNYFKY